MVDRIQHHYVTSNQLRAARALLEWSQEDAATASGLGIATIRRMEGESEPKKGRALAHLISAMEERGIQFLNDASIVGVVLRRNP